MAGAVKTLQVDYPSEQRRRRATFVQSMTVVQRAELRSIHTVTPRHDKTVLSGLAGDMNLALRS